MARPKSKTTKPRVNMTIEEGVVKEARKAAAQAGFNSLSECVEFLLDEMNKRVRGEKESKRGKLAKSVAESAANR